MLNKTDVLLEINFHNNYEIIANWILELKKKYPKNKKILNMEKAIVEIYFHVNNLQLQQREYLADNSNLKYEFNKFKQEFYSLNTQ